ncbi:MAG: DUF2726 domain-containing protein [Nitrospira sp.]|nr:DUF2726 domain-containing protein [Nitrospira sp.]
MKDVVIGGAVVAITVTGWLIARFKRPAAAPPPFILPTTVNVVSLPLLTEKESALYNQLQLAVRDQYLVFAGLSLWAFVSVQGLRKDRLPVLKRLMVTQVDFALVHPGSRKVELVVLLHEEPSTAMQRERDYTVESVASAAGIKVVKVRSDRLYSIPELTCLLGMAEQGEDF